jgi:nucleoside-diphosphate-sugar epimerase
MRVCLTGATGNLGGHVLTALLQDGHVVRCLVRRPRVLRRLAARQGARSGQVEIVPGDVCDAAQVTASVSGQDVVVHLAALLPPVSDFQPERARAVNVGGTRNILESIRVQPRPPRLIYASTVALFGMTQDQPPPRRVGDPVQPMDAYSQHKAECEELIRQSGLTWTILRLTAVPRFNESFDPSRIRAMFSINPGDRMEAVHPYDAGRALANAVNSPHIAGNTLIIAGGPSCRMLMRDYYRAFLDAVGIGTFPDSAYSQESYHLDYYDTAESQALLRYQQHTFDDFARELRRRFFWQRLGVALVRPALRAFLLRYSSFAQRGSAPPRPPPHVS